MSKKEELTSTFGALQSTIDRSKGSRSHKTASKAEAEQRIKENRTQGKKGAKMPRKNLSFTQDNYEFITKFAKCRGSNYTEFVNHIIDEYRKAHQKEFEKMLEFLENT